MAVQLTNGTTLVSVGATNHALSTQLLDAAGNSMTPVSGTILTETQGALLVGGMAEGDHFNNIKIDPLGNIGIANSRAVFMERCDGTVINTARWTTTVATMAASQTALGVVLNTASVLTAGTSIVMTSRRQFGRNLSQPLNLSMLAKVTAPTNSSVDFGFGLPTTTVISTPNSVVWRVSGQSAVPVVVVNGTEVTGAAIDISAYAVAGSYLVWDIFVEDFTVTFLLKVGETGVILSHQEVEISATLQKMFGGASLPLSLRVWNAATGPASAAMLTVTDLSVVALLDASMVPIEDTQAGLHLGSENIPATGLQSATYANSAAPASATLSNTAAGYATLGGLFQFAAVAGAATDYALFGYQIPAGVNFFCTGVNICAWNTVAAVATTPTLMHWGMMVNSTAVSLATTASRFPIGAMSLPIGTVAGGMADKSLDVLFEAPKFCSSGSFLVIILRMPVATATATEVIAGSCRIGGYFTYM